MNSSTPTSTASETSPQSTPRRFWPPLKVWLVSLLFLIFGLVGWFGQVLGNGPLAPLYDLVSGLRDPAVCNILLLIGTFFALFVPLLWFTIRSACPTPLRYLPLTVAVVAVGGFFAVFKIQGVSGELIPRMGYRFGAAPDQRLGQIEGEVTTQQNSTPQDEAETITDPHAFPQFLGPNRNSFVSGPALETDWQSQPPEALWRIEIGAGWSGFAAVDGFAYTMEQRGPREYVSCYRIEDGKPVWGTAIEARHETVLGYVGPRCTPLVWEGRVYALGATGVFRCLDQKTGDVLWQHDLLEMMDVTPQRETSNIAWGRANSPLVYHLPERSIVVIPAGGPSPALPEKMASLVAFDASSGEVVWKGGDQQISYASPSIGTVDEQEHIITVNESSITGHDPANGNVLWSIDWPGSSSGSATCSQVHDLGDNQFFVSKGYGQGARVFTVTPTEQGEFQTSVVWDSSRVLKTKFSNVAIQDGYAFGMNDGILEKVSLTDPKPLWRKRGFGHGQIFLVGDVLLVMGEEGELAAVDATSDKYQELGRITALSSKIAPTWNPLCVYGDLLLVRNAEEAACYRLPTK